MTKIKNIEDSLYWRGCGVRLKPPPLLAGVGVELQVFLNAKKSLQIPIYKFIEGLNKR